jgi:hypothetical protein
MTQEEPSEAYLLLRTSIRSAALCQGKQRPVPERDAAQIAPVLDQRRQLLLIMDGIADKVVQKYQNSTCGQLWQKRGHGPFPPIARAMNQSRKMRARPTSTIR